MNEDLFDRFYPFIIYKEKDTGYYVLDFVDLVNCYVVGGSVEEVLALKDKVKRSYLKVYYDIYGYLPEPTDLSGFKWKGLLKNRGGKVK